MLNGRRQDGVQQEAVAAIVGPMSGVKRESFNKGASGESWDRAWLEWAPSRKAWQSPFSSGVSLLKGRNDL